MIIPLQIDFEGGLTASDAVRQRIESEVAKLEKFQDKIIGCRVAMIGRSGRRRHGDLFGVRLQISVPGRRDIVIDRNPPEDHAHEDPYVAIRDAFRAARRQLQDHRRRQEGEVKAHEEPPHGRIARVFPDEGYGFIESSDGREIYFHRNAVVNNGFEKLKAGALVRFAETEGEKGAQASTVHVLGKTHSFAV
ncbi:MAG TPA: HPF/RaiA family ribosome-associated protein [Caulobacteraceae bacterium]|nr:HPF/RaiA family ribosome-associated protein [Caulobacteraceae bacterium]